MRDTTPPTRIEAERDLHVDQLTNPRIPFRRIPDLFNDDPFTNIQLDEEPF